MTSNSGRSNGKTPPPPPAPPAGRNVWMKPEFKVHFLVRHPWQWVMSEISKEWMIEQQSTSELPSSVQARRASQNGLSTAELTPSTRRRRSGRPKGATPSTLKIELCDPSDNTVIFAAHGSSTAFDGLEDKDELVRTVKRCRCDHLNFTPPSVLISWDVSKDECRNVVGKDLPVLAENTSDKKVAVLKEPMGSQGKGIYFVSTEEDIHDIINDHHQRALKEPQLLDGLIEAKGRIPSWVLQAEVAPYMLIRNGRKFHIRSYVVALEQLDHEDLCETYVYNRHEVRVAGVAVDSDDNGTNRDRLAHITNGALSNTTERVLLSDVEELREMQAKVELFVAEMFAKHLMPDIARRVSYNASHSDRTGPPTNEFAIAGLDIMVTEQGRLYLLEVNKNPAAPRESTIGPEFRNHLTGFMHDLIDLVVGVDSPNFVPADAILEKHGR